MKALGRTLILGATSGVGRAVARRLATRGLELVVAGRDESELRAMSRDLVLRTRTPVSFLTYDATDFASHKAFFDACVSESNSPLSGVVFCQGTMSDQREAEQDFALARHMIDVNYASAVSLLNLASAHFAGQGSGFVCALSSVAGDRGRQSNYVYGSTKAALTTYLQGLRNRMAKLGVHVITIKPGFVDTAMTWGLLKPGSPLVASADRVAGDIVRAIDRRKNVVYTPWFWWGIMGIIKSIPEPIFKRLKM
jgi:short-subunit dehydrogenase